MGLALISHQLGYFNILPLYIILMLWAPFALAIALRDSLARAHRLRRPLCGGARFGLNLPNWPQPGGWFLNPIAWQLVFTMGVVSAIWFRSGPPRPSSLALALSAATVAAAALIVTSEEGGLAPGLREAATAHLDVAKQDLRTGAARPFYRAGLSHRGSADSGAIMAARLIRGGIGDAVQSLSAIVWRCSPPGRS